MTTERRLAAGVALLALAVGGAVAAGWIRPAAVAGAGIGALYQIRVPDLSDPAMIRRGAAHYDRVCARCHGSPDRPERGRHLALRPPAPTLHLRLDDWPPEHLFRIVRDGIADSAMPAWPAEGRDDEVWSIVAFLVALPELDPGQYRRLAAAEIDAALPPHIQPCAQCHGADGRGQGPVPQAFPRIDIQTEAYLRDALTAFRDGNRASGIMQAAAGALTDAEIAAVARHYAAPDLVPGMDDTAPPLVARGDPGRKISACAACHGPPAPVRDGIPRLAGQHADYLAQQLRLFVAEDGHRGGGPLIDLMTHAVPVLSAQDIRALADWYAARPDP